MDARAGFLLPHVPMAAEPEEKKPDNPDPVAITAQELIKRLESLKIEFEYCVKYKRDVSELKAEVAKIRYYFSHPNLVHNATFYGGVLRIKKNYAALLLQISSYIDRQVIFDTKQASLLNRLLGNKAQRHKVKRAYTELYRGEKFRKAKLGEFNVKYPASTPNPVQVESEKNLQKLKEELRDSKESFYIRDDEAELYETLLNLPYRLQHATNFHYPILNAGALDSYTEIKRREPDYTSTFSTNGNIHRLGNGGFVFFRLYVEPINGADTRYGDTSLIFDLSLLRTCGWVSLHDQLKPFPSKSPNSRHLYWDKRLLRTSEAVAIKNNTQEEVLHDGLCYQYRSLPIKRYTGAKDTLKSFNDTIPTTESQRSFLNEMFYGGDILPGIALSVIRELRHLEACGFRQHFLAEFSAASPDNKIKMLGELLKGLFRIEGKYPVALRLHADARHRNLFFTPIARTDNFEQKGDDAFTVLNPDGDGRFNMDMTVNPAALAYAELCAEQQTIAAQLSNARQQKARCKDKQKIRHYENQIEGLKAREQRVNQQMDESKEARHRLVNYFVANHEASLDDFAKVSTVKMQFIRAHYEEFLSDDVVPLAVLLAMPLRQLQLIADESLFDLMADDLVTFEELARHSIEDLVVLSSYDIAKALSEHGKTIPELLALYKDDPMHLECLTCDSLEELVLEQAPDVDQLVLQYAEEEDVDLEWVEDQLCESDAMLFRINLGWEDEVPSEQDDYDYQSEYEEQDPGEDGQEPDDVEMQEISSGVGGVALQIPSPLSSSSSSSLFAGSSSSALPAARRGAAAPMEEPVSNAAAARGPGSSPTRP